MIDISIVVITILGIILAVRWAEEHFKTRRKRDEMRRHIEERIEQ